MESYISGQTGSYYAQLREHSRSYVTGVVTHCDCMNTGAGRVSENSARPASRATQRTAKNMISFGQLLKSLQRAKNNNKG
ncbi:hypothetical protein [Endozoicomonas sp. ONNA2]|uniref:hypothetical protein n=1 Tax=Endozoicomonas sp. ONNA2 TaxID=2828741 RepID=UPI0021486091|nr:hypothetical protein [Endozoicomonas sp. ONNA2]